jgi:DNA polymerase I-like protein with 3'-5' exonuclease and polymerase domains
MKLLVHFKKLCSNILDNGIPDELVKYESDFSSALYQIEKNGMYVEDFKLGSSDLINDQNLVFTQYNMLTPTGRPSNSFGNVNYVALNKKTGDRSCFKSRFGNDGLLVMIDYESYHLRLVGNFLEYNLPTSSLHEYLGKIYYGKSDLTEEEYELSKKITFNLIYGGIDDDIKNNVPFMKCISDYVENTYSDFKKVGYAETWRYKRKIYSKFFGDKINSYKVFNYLLQSAETERNCIILNQINSYLKECVSKLILYTYDAFLFDVHKDEFLKFKEIDPVITSNGKFPVRTYIGKSYDSVRQI